MTEDFRAQFIDMATETVRDYANHADTLAEILSAETGALPVVRLEMRLTVDASHNDHSNAYAKMSFRHEAAIDSVVGWREV